MTKNRQKINWLTRKIRLLSTKLHHWGHANPEIAQKSLLMWVYCQLLTLSVCLFQALMGDFTKFSRKSTHGHVTKIKYLCRLKYVKSRLEMLTTLRSQIEGYSRLLIFRKVSSYPLLFEPPHLLTFKKISSLFVFSSTQMKFFPSSPLILEPTHLLNLGKNSSLPFY